MVHRTTRAGERRGRLRQRRLPFLESARSRERWFKGVILAVTVVTVLGLLAVMPDGRRGMAALARRLEGRARSALRIGSNRAAVEADRQARRMREIAETRQRYGDYFANDASPGLRRILRAAKMAPEDVLLRWANLDWTVIFSPLVFEADDCGRAYRMRPRTRSFWLVNHTLTRGLTSFFFLPDTPEVQAAVAEAGAAIMPESYQTTNSWGCRGPEPELDAAVRVLVLGDSFVQGLFVPDDETPPEHLRRFLALNGGRPVSVLNTGHIGYSPEQYFHTLRAYYDRFHPQCVVVNVCPNDFGESRSVLEGRGDWSEAKHWLDAILLYCRARRTPCLLVAAPLEIQVVGTREAGFYPGCVANLWDANGYFFLDLAEPFVDEHLRLTAGLIRANRRPQSSPLFNGHLHDAHFSAAGAALWGREVGRRLLRLLDYDHAARQ